MFVMIVKCMIISSSQINIRHEKEKCTNINCIFPGDIRKFQNLNYQCDPFDASDMLQATSHHPA
jgi:hypothetical protein